jgi:molecular chaperone GrpE (heat shock protein)
MENVKTPVAKKVGNKTTEIIVGTAVSKLTTVVKGINDAVQEVNKLETRIQDGTLKVTDLEDKIGGLEQDFKNKVAQSKIELEQAYTANRESFVGQFLAEKKMAMIPSKELGDLQLKLEEATSKVEDAVSKAVGIATGTMKSAHANEIKIANLEHEKKEANNMAEITQLKAQNKFLEDQVSHWKNMLDAQVKAETERAKYGAINTLNVGTPTGR